MIVLGLTGSLAMGKSTAATLLRQMKIPVHDADAAVHDLYRNDLPFLRQLYDYFPECYDRKRKAFDRKQIADIIFADAGRKKILETLLHPRVQEREKSFLKKCSRLKQPLVVLDIPLLYETGAEVRCDYVMVVSAPPTVQKSRALSRPGMTENIFYKILATQISDTEKRARADFVISTGLGWKRTCAEIRGVLDILGG
ncbi:MAG: dephospho-CoA kinase [Rhodospirillales bacterium]|nr:dephospho-CoA kinase [Rhodospirillales bacterium]MCB9979647.1 dephospho-CoA kinase [Rhodospirillales bacterium]